MTEKKRVELTKTEDRILKAIKTTMNKAPEGRARKLHSMVCGFLKEQQQEVSTAMVRIFIEWMAREKVLVEIARDMPAGDKVISILYEFNEEAYKAREFMVVSRRKVSPYEEGIKKEKKKPTDIPEKKEGVESKGFIDTIYRGMVALHAEKQSSREKVQAELFLLDSEIERLREGIEAFEKGAQIGRELLEQKK